MSVYRTIGPLVPLFFGSGFLITLFLVDFSNHYFTAGEHVERAFNLGLAAVLGQGVYNFGELVGWHTFTVA